MAVYLYANLTYYLKLFAWKKMRASDLYGWCVYKVWNLIFQVEMLWRHSIYTISDDVNGMKEEKQCTTINISIWMCVMYVRVVMALEESKLINK